MLAAADKNGNVMQLKQATHASQGTREEIKTHRLFEHHREERFRRTEGSCAAFLGKLPQPDRVGVRTRARQISAPSSPAPAGSAV